MAAPTPTQAIKTALPKVDKLFAGSEENFDKIPVDLHVDYVPFVFAERACRSTDGSFRTVHGNQPTCRSGRPPGCIITNIHHQDM